MLLGFSFEVHKQGWKWGSRSSVLLGFSFGHNMAGLAEAFSLLPRVAHCSGPSVGGSLNIDLLKPFNIIRGSANKGQRGVA